MTYVYVQIGVYASSNLNTLNYIPKVDAPYYLFIHINLIDKKTPSTKCYCLNVFYILKQWKYHTKKIKPIMKK